MASSQQKATERHIVEDCPVCKRTIWGGSVCHHGKVPVVRVPYEGLPKILPKAVKRIYGGKECEGKG